MFSVFNYELTLRKKSFVWDTLSAGFNTMDAFLCIESSKLHQLREPIRDFVTECFLVSFKQLIFAVKFVSPMVI